MYVWRSEDNSHDQFSLPTIWVLQIQPVSSDLKAAPTPPMSSSRGQKKGI